jgi:hypothetical protein
LLSAIRLNSKTFDAHVAENSSDILRLAKTIRSGDMASSVAEKYIDDIAHGDRSHESWNKDLLATNQRCAAVKAWVSIRSTEKVLSDLPSILFGAADFPRGSFDEAGYPYPSSNFMEPKALSCLETELKSRGKDIAVPLANFATSYTKYSPEPGDYHLFAFELLAGLGIDAKPVADQMLVLIPFDKRMPVNDCKTAASKVRGWMRDHVAFDCERQNQLLPQLQRIGAIRVLKSLNIKSIPPAKAIVQLLSSILALNPEEIRFREGIYYAELILGCEILKDSGEKLDADGMAALSKLTLSSNSSVRDAATRTLVSLR